MDLNRLPLGTPEKFNVLIEIPAGSSNKYEYSEEFQGMYLDYVFRDGFHFIHNYGSVPHTKAEDGDPLDALVISSYPIAINVAVWVKPIGILKLKDRGEQDNKLITVPVVDPLAEQYNSLADLSETQKQEIHNFFVQVGVQKNKSMDIEGFFDKDVAMEEIKKSTI
jgi:inorganic pyrophosphatase